MEFLTRLMPTEVAGPALIAGLGWLALNHFVLSPEIADRLAVKYYIPACTSGLEAEDSKRLEDHERKVAHALADHADKADAMRRRAEAARAEIQRKMDLAEGLLAISPFGKVIEQLDPDGKFKDLADQALPQLPELDLDIPEATLPAAPRVMTPEDRAVACVLAAEEVRAKHQWDYTLFTASLTLYEPASIRDIDMVMLDIVEGQS